MGPERLDSKFYIKGNTMSMEMMIQKEVDSKKSTASGSGIAIAFAAGSIVLSIFLGMAHTQYEAERKSLHALSEIKAKKIINKIRVRKQSGEIPGKDKAELNRILLALEGGEK